MWFLYVVLSSLFSCFYYFGNQAAKIKPNVFMIYRGAGPALVLLPMLLWVKPIEAWQFYAFCALQGCIIAFIDYRNFLAMRVWGAEAVAALHPLSIGLVFVFWMLIKPYMFLNYMDNIWKFVGILLALGGILYATVSFQKARNVRKLLYYMLPFFIGAAMVDVINKICMSYATSAQLQTASGLYVIITGAVVALINLLLYIKNNNKLNELFNESNLKYAPIILLIIGCMVTKNLAMFNVGNPAFVMATLYIYIIWIMLFGKFDFIRKKLGAYRRLDYRKAILLLICSVVLILLEN